MKKKILIPLLALANSIPLTCLVSCNKTPSEPKTNDCLTFTAMGDGLVLAIFNECTNEDTAPIPQLYYSIDNGEPKEYHIIPKGHGEILTLNEGQTISFWGNNPNGFSFYDGEDNENKSINSFLAETRDEMHGAKVSGNIMSLIDGGACKQTTIPCSGCFKNIFGKECLEGLDDFKLPATELKPYCYSEMFEQGWIEEAPELPATTLADYCYQGMFNKSTITKLPSLPANVLAEGCYEDMFNGCGENIKINSDWFVKNIFNRQDVVFAKDWSNNMFGNCYTTRDQLFELPASDSYDLKPYCFSGLNAQLQITSVPNDYLAWDTLAEGCYEDMFDNCSSLTTVPDLSATTLDKSCYEGMFKECKALESAPSLPTTNLAPYCYKNMFYGCRSLKISPQLPATRLVEGCYEYMFEKCTSLTTAPNLPATTLANSCYYSMFSNCNFLSVAPKLPATTLAEGCYQYMFYDCSSLCIKEQDTKTEDEGYIFTCPSEGSIPEGAVTDMFSGIRPASEFQDGTPNPGKSYYWYPYTE